MNRIQIAALTISLALHASMVGTMNGHKWISGIVPPVPIMNKPDVSLEFIETPDSVPESKDTKATKVISDKTVDAKDNFKKEIKEHKARVKDVYKGKQIPKASQQIIPTPPAPPEPIVKPQVPETKGPVQEEQKKQPAPAEKQQPKVEYDIINIPEISESIFSAPDEGPLAFEAQAHKIGPYFKQIKKKIERYWLSYLLFKYQNTAPQPSEVAVKFKILPSGEVAGVTVLEYSGDRLFRDFSVASIVNTSPFPPLPDNLKEELKKEGGLDIVFTFRYM